MPQHPGQPLAPPLLGDHGPRERQEHSWRQRPAVSDWDTALTGILAPLGPLMMRAFRHAHAPDVKPDGSFVTQTDRTAEAHIVAALHQAFPAHGVVGEEGSRRPATAGAPTWYIDPLDGTGAFMEGLAHWGPVLTAMDDQGVVGGAMFLPRLDELWFYERGVGAFRDRQRLLLRSARPTPPTRTLLVGGAMLQHLHIRWRGRLRNLGSTAAHLAIVAAGGASAAIVGPGWGTWDTALGLALIRATGGASACLGTTPTPADAPPCSPSIDAPSPAHNVDRLSSDTSLSSVHPVADAGLPFVAGAPTAVARVLRPETLRPHLDPS